MERVFIAEDSMDIMRVYCSVFKKCGYEVETAFDGEEAIKKLLSAKFKLKAILLDIMMPKKTGFDVLPQIKQAGSPVKDVPVIALTNWESLLGGEEDLKKIKSLGAVDIIIKSQIDPQDLVKKVGCLA